MNNLSSVTGMMPLPPEFAALADVANGNDQEAMKKVAEQFEGIFFSLMLKEMRQSVSIDQDGGLFAGESSDTFGGMFDLFLGQHLASSSPLGIGQMLAQYRSNG
ncbi:MAG: rod-binding protein [Pirellulaceae bacterium]